MAIDPEVQARWDAYVQHQIDLASPANREAVRAWFAARSPSPDNPPAPTPPAPQG